MRKEHLKHGFVPLGFELVNLPLIAVLYESRPKALGLAYINIPRPALHLCNLWNTILIMSIGVVVSFYPTSCCTLSSSQ